MIRMEITSADFCLTLSELCLLPCVKQCVCVPAYVWSHVLIMSLSLSLNEGAVALNFFFSADLIKKHNSIYCFTGLSFFLLSWRLVQNYVHWLFKMNIWEGRCPAMWETVCMQLYSCFVFETIRLRQTILIVTYKQ